MHGGIGTFYSNRSGPHLGMAIEVGLTYLNPLLLGVGLVLSWFGLEQVWILSVPDPRRSICFKLYIISYNFSQK